MNHFKSTIIIKANPEKVFKALTAEISLWWGHQDKLVQSKGDLFRVSWGEPWYEFEVVEYNPNTSLKWKCIDANQIITGLEGVQKEWIGSFVNWEIESLDYGVSKITCVHIGLTAELICYDVCSSTWDRYIQVELKQYLESGIKG
ncbi:MAG: SRPBCC domain-containing protein [Saprospiraceae bacterium]|nr:SRPBCC domain-containing protein [Saprospiraceae bacterium]